MALNPSVQVPLPEHGIAFKKVSGKTYVYYVTATYRNEKGRPTCDRTSIGRLDEASGKLIPNRNYYEIYLNQSQPLQGGIFDYGVYYVFYEIAKELGLYSMLKKLFPDNFKEILTVAQYMFASGNVMSYIDYYTQTHETVLKEELRDTRCSKLFASIRQEDIFLFMREWMKRMKKDEYLAYDVTSISSYAKNMEELEWGYNRDKERLPQINMGMYYGEKTKLPLYYRIYPGSISDKVHLRYMVEDNAIISNERVRYVMDRGFYSSENLNFLVSNAYRFIIALPLSLRYCQNLIKKHKNEIVNISECKLGKHLPYAKSCDVNELGFRMRAHIYYEPEKALRDSEALYELIERQENDLKAMEEPPEKKYHYDRYFFINRSKEGKLGFVRNHKAIDEALSMCGFFIIAETDFRKSSKEILEIYRNRDVVEKSFDNLKNELDFKRLHTHNRDTTQGKIFVSFIALIIKSYILNHTNEGLQMTQKQLLLELDKIKILKFNEKSKPRLINPLTKSQRSILEALNLSPDPLFV